MSPSVAVINHCDDIEVDGTLLCVHCVCAECKVSRVQLPPGWSGGMSPRCCAVEGLFPQQISAQSVQSSGSGRDERWGLGGNATTHFTGKSGPRSSDRAQVTQAYAGLVISSLFLYFR